MPTTASKLPVFGGKIEDIFLGESCLDLVLENIANGITVQNKDGKVIYANDAAAQATGLVSAEELISTPVAKIFDKFEMLDKQGESYDLNRLPGRRALLGEKAPSDLICFRIKKTGEVRWAHV